MSNYFQPSYTGGAGYMRPQYQQQAQPQYIPQQYTYQPQPITDSNPLQARFVSGREEAVASNVIPGSMFVFVDRANGQIFLKAVDPATGLATFEEFSKSTPQPEKAPIEQFMPVNQFETFRAEIEKRLSALERKKGGNADV